MIRSYILEKTNQMPVHTDMRRVFDALGGKQIDYNWLVTDLVYYADLRRSAANELLSGESELDEDQLSGWPTEALAADGAPIWIAGDELTRIIEGNDLQFVWGVFSGFRKNMEINLETLSVIPYADGNPDLWGAQPRIQHPLAEIEIVCWDSTATLFFSEDEELAERFRQHFTDCEDLAGCNTRAKGEREPI